jgi:hypothetical protein
MENGERYTRDVVICADYDGSDGGGNAYILNSDGDISGNWLPLRPSRR